MKTALEAVIVMVIVVQAMLGRADELTYTKGDSAPYLWHDAAAWGGAVPTASDDAVVYGNFAGEAPFTVQNAAVARTFDIGSRSLSQNGDVLNMMINADLTVSADDSIWGYRATTNNITIAGGAVFSVSTNRLGYTDHPVVNVFNYGTANYGFLMIGNYNGSNCRYDNYGNMSVNYSLYMGRGTQSGGGEEKSGEALLYLHRGSTFERLTTASEKNGYSFDFIGVESKATIISETDITLPPGDVFNLGSNNGGEGSLVLQDEAVFNRDIRSVSINMASGTGSRGDLTLKDSAKLYLNKTTSQFNVAEGSNSVATITMSGATEMTLKNSGAAIGIGRDSSTTLDLSGSAVLNLCSATYFATGRVARIAFNLADSACITTTDYYIGGDGATVTAELTGDSNFKSTRQFSYLATDPTGSGEIVLKDASFQLRGRDPADGFNPLVIGGAGADAVIRGYGVFNVYVGVPTSSNTKRLFTTMRGRIVADGFGADNDLDCSYLTLSNQTDTACANAGWYARNHGCLILPHTEAMTGGTMLIGENTWREGNPTVVNSMRVTLTGADDGCFMHANLYAPDHTAVPAGLPSTGADEVLSIWNMGYSGSGQFSKKAGTADGKNFTSAEVKIRHATTFNHRKSDYYTIVGYRYDGTEWVKVSEQNFSAENPYYTFTGLPKVTGTGTGYNMGWIAVVAHYYTPGTMMILK